MLCFTTFTYSHLNKSLIFWYDAFGNTQVKKDKQMYNIQQFYYLKLKAYEQTQIGK